MQIKGGEFRKRISALSPGTKILVIPHFSYIPDQILEKKKEKNQFSGQNLTFLKGSPLPKYDDVFKFFYMTKRFWFYTSNS